MSDLDFGLVNNYSAIRISLAGPDDIRSWSFGEVKRPETISYRTYRPEQDGLFCERTFGPKEDWQCSCGKYRGIKHEGMTCDRCGFKVTDIWVRLKRMGHIELAAPVVHLWFFKAMPSRLGALLAMKTTGLERVIYFHDYVVTDPGTTPLKHQALLTELDYHNAQREYGGTAFQAHMGAEAIRRLLTSLDLVKLSEELRKELRETHSRLKKTDLADRLKIVESLRQSDNRPEWMVLDVVPVVPRDDRPLVRLDSGNFARSDLNDLYRWVIRCNNRLKTLVGRNAPEVIIKNEKRLLQQSVDALFGNNRCDRRVLGSRKRPLKSLTDRLKGIQGRFRQRMLEKRVDYSARSVIVVGPNLRLHQCGLPKRIAVELYKPFLIRRIMELCYADTTQSAKRMIERRDDEVWEILDDVVRNHPVLLHRSPTLHRMGIQAFEPVLVNGSAIELHPLVCKGFNADFDGDQMAVHLPLSIEAQVEARTLLMATSNLFHPANGAPLLSPSAEMVLGCYYLTLALANRKGDGMTFASMEEVQLAYSLGKVATHAQIRLRLPPGRAVKDRPEIAPGSIVQTTVGRAVFNSILPAGMVYYNEPMKSSALAGVIADCYEILGRRATIDLLDDLKTLGFRMSTRSGLSFGTDDLITASNRAKVIADAEKKVARSMRMYEKGVITEGERYSHVLDAWTHAREEITTQMMKELESDERYPGYVNPVFLMAQSGARGGVDQIRRSAGMCGLMANRSGRISETPIKGNFRVGLSVLEYFISTHVARIGQANEAPKAADSGCLTRKLADAAGDVVVTMRDCGTTQGITKGVIYCGDRIEVSLADAIKGRVSRAAIINPITDEVVVRENQLITAAIGRQIEEMGLEKIQVRSPMTCDAPRGVCALCYGMDLSTGSLVEEGTAVGIIAVQSIGEPGTQLTIRNFHFDSAVRRIVEEGDIRAMRSGVVKFTRLKVVRNDAGETVVLSRNGKILLLDEKGRELENHEVPAGARLLVQENQKVQAGAVLCEWDPHAIPIVAQVGGKVRYEDVIEGETMRVEKDAGVVVRRFIIEHMGGLHPQIVLEDEAGKIRGFYYLPEKAFLQVQEGDVVSPGTLLAKTPRQVLGTRSLTGGLPRETDFFEARKPKDPAVIAEIEGVVILLGENRRGKRTIHVLSETGIEREHLVSHGYHLRVHAGDFVRAGEALVDGPLSPHDILRVLGEEAVQQYLIREIQDIYRSQRVEIDDKHIEIILAQMLRMVKVESGGDTDLVEGSLIDKFDFRKANEQLTGFVKVTDPGDTDVKESEILKREVLEQKNAEFEAIGGRPAKFIRLSPATASSQLLGVTAVAARGPSFLSRATVREPAAVLTEAALAGKVDHLAGLKENAILGRLIPAGTGFRPCQGAEVRLSPSAIAEFGAGQAARIASKLEELFRPASDEHQQK